MLGTGGALRKGLHVREVYAPCTVGCLRSSSWVRSSNGWSAGARELPIISAEAHTGSTAWVDVLCKLSGDDQSCTQNGPRERSTQLEEHRHPPVQMAYTLARASPQLRATPVPSIRALGAQLERMKIPGARS